jgi:hypothetical protein
MRPPRLADDRGSGVSLASAALVCGCVCVCIGLVAALALVGLVADASTLGSCCVALAANGGSRCVEHTNASACEGLYARSNASGVTFSANATCASSPVCPGATLNQSNTQSCCQLPGPSCTNDITLVSSCTALGGTTNASATKCTATTGRCIA